MSCQKKIKEKTFFGVTVSRTCGKPCESNLCAKHRYSRNLKQTPWGERKTYRTVTESEFTRGKSVKLKDSTKHVIYRYQNGIIQSQDRHGKWIDTDLSIPFDKFCIKDPYLSNIF